MSLWTQHQLGLTFFLLVILGICLGNLVRLRRMSSFSPPRELPYISVLVPARNEDSSIRRCLESLLDQDYPRFELLVLDDDSSDGTWELVSGMAARDPRLRTLRGRPLPEGWTGKNWACHQLAEHAKGELLLFTDADTVHGPGCLAAAAGAASTLQADLITAFPRQETGSPGERLFVPLLGWSILCFFPLPLAHRLRTPWLSAAIGQFMLFRREAYFQIGGHSAVRAEVAEDFALARAVKAAGLRWRFLDAGDLVGCRMYRGISSAFRGLAKSLFPAFGNRVLLFLFIWTWLAVVFLEPVLVLALAAAGVTRSATAIGFALLECGLALLVWALAARHFRHPLYLTLAYPLIIAAGEAAAFSSLYLNLRGSAVWKDRLLPQPRLRWP